MCSGLVSAINSASVSPLPDFTSLSAQLASISPSSTAASDYSTGTLTARACPTVGGTWLATNTPLPPSPNGALCDCLGDTLGCVVAGTTSTDDYADIFNYICTADSGACAEILANGTTGVYGVYSGCASEQQLNYVINEYYLNQDSAASACSFSGSATLASSTAATGTCSSLLAEASSGTVASPTAKASSTTSGSGSTSTGTTTSTSSASASKSGAAVGSPVPSVQFGLFSVGLYVFGAVLTGFGMIIL